MFVSHTKTTKPLQLYGNVDIREVALGMRVNGKLSVVNREEGEHVHIGEELAKLDDAPFLENLASAKGEVDSRSATLDKLIAGPRPSEIDKARADVNAKKADLINAEQTLSRIKKLRHNETVSQAALDQAVASFDMAKGDFQSSSAALQYLLDGTRVEDIAVARANLAAAKAQRDSAKTALQDTILVAPADGIIRSRIREPGSILAAGEPVYVLSLVKPLRVRGYVDEPNLARIHPGQMVAISNDTSPEKQYRGTIGFISSTAEFTPKTVETPQLRSNLVYRFFVTLNPNETGLLQGMPVTITIEEN